MTEFGIPFTGTTVGDAALAPYGIGIWETVIKTAGYGANRANYGIVRGTGTGVNEALYVQENSPPAANVVVLPGLALVDGTVYSSDANITLAIGSNISGNPRIDTIILRKDTTAQTVRAVVLPGTPAPTPTPTTLTQTALIYEIPLAYVTVPSGFVSITNANIRQSGEYCNASDGVYLDNILNNSGATLEDGDVVVLDTSANRAASTTTTLDNPNVLGVWRGRTLAAAYGRVQVRGVGLVSLNAASTARGLGVTTSTTARQGAVSLNTPRLGVTLETTSAAGLCLCLINPTSPRRIDYLKYVDQKASGTAGGASAAGAWQTRTLNVEEHDTGGWGTLASNQVTLQPGTYWFSANAPAGASNAANMTQFHKLRLQNITAGTTVAVGGNESVSQSNSASGTSSQSRAFVSGLFTITAPTVFELQHYTSATLATAGLGWNVSAPGVVEVYAVLEFWRLNI